MLPDQAAGQEGEEHADIVAGGERGERGCTLARLVEI
jgi:hypothetical protein